MKEIHLTQDKTTLIDDEDFGWLNEWKWYAWREPKSGLFYAFAANPVKDNEPRRPLSMSRLIMRPKKDQLVDHRDRNSLNNQKSNLRLCDRAQNNVNKRALRPNSFRGVFFIDGNLKRPFRTYFSFRKQAHHGGYHATAEEAALAYDALVKRYCPDFGILNFPTKG